MSTYAITQPSAQALAFLLRTGGDETLMLSHAEHTLMAKLHLEPAGEKLEVSIALENVRSTITLDSGDAGNAQHLISYIESIANGTAETASDVPGHTGAALCRCSTCGDVAIGISYLATGSTQDWLYGVQCRHNGCKRMDGYANEAEAYAAWNLRQTEAKQVAPVAPTQSLMKSRVAERLAAEASSSDQGAADMVNHPPHYNGHPSGVECIEVTELLSFNLGNAFKYAFRHRSKNGREDLEKCQWYLNRAISSSYAQEVRPTTAKAAELAARIAQHEGYILGSMLVAIANGKPLAAERHLEQLLEAA